MKVYEPELMGLFGLSWQEKVTALTYKKVNAIDKTIAKQLKDFFQSGSLNVRTLENMHREYIALMAQGYKPSVFVNGVPDSSTLQLIPKIKDKLNIDELIILKFLESLFELSAAGKIPYAKWNPKGYKESTALQKTFPSEKTVLDNVQKGAKIGTVLLIVAGVGVSLYYLNNIERLRRHGT